MTSDEKDSKSAKPSGRSQRLAVELRENLRKRKAQERGRTASPDTRERSKTNLAGRDER
jgi:hypothetical protein